MWVVKVMQIPPSLQEQDLKNLARKAPDTYSAALDSSVLLFSTPQETTA